MQGSELGTRQHCRDNVIRPQRSLQQHQQQQQKKKEKQSHPKKSLRKVYISLPHFVEFLNLKITRGDRTGGQEGGGGHIPGGYFFCTIEHTREAFEPIQVHQLRLQNLSPLQRNGKSGKNSFLARMLCYLQHLFWPHQNHHRNLKQCLQQKQPMPINRNETTKQYLFVQYGSMLWVCPDSDLTVGLERKLLKSKKQHRVHT